MQTTVHLLMAGLVVVDQYLGGPVTAEGTPMPTPPLLATDSGSRLQSVRQAAEDPALQHLVELIKARALRWTANPTLVVPGELGDWWHVCWERLSDVAFAQAVDPDDARAVWLRTEVLRLCALPADAWIGPFFRPRYAPIVGMLETAHVGLGVTTVLELCPDLLDEDDTLTVHAALREKCLLPCERGLLTRETGLDVTANGAPVRVSDYTQNWYWVLLDAFGAVALLLGDSERVETLPARFRRGQALHNADSYGESVQYWGYAALHLTNLWELVQAYRPDLIRRLDQRHGNVIPWLVHSVLFTGQSRSWGPGRYTTMVNFGDSALTGRPPADVLSSVARFAAAGDARAAGLARWLLDVTYGDAELAPTELSSFGFFNQVGWRTIANLPHAAPALSPERADLGLAASFETGTVAVRDRWAEPRAVLAAQTGHATLNVDSHRHDDDGTFVLGYGGEVFFADPGHCCYRLQAYFAAVKAEAHSGWTLRNAEGQELPRPRVPETAVGHRFGPDEVGAAIVFGVDLAPAYPEQVQLARRTWISLLPHVVIVVDDVVASTPVVVESRFVLNNQDNRLRVNEASTSRLVLRRDGAAAKFFRLESDAGGHHDSVAPRRSWSALHDIYHPQPNAPTQGKEGSGVVYTYSTGTPATTVRSVYSIVMAAESTITGWHVHYEDDVVTVTPPDGPAMLVRLTDYVAARTDPAG